MRAICCEDLSSWCEYEDEDLCRGVSMKILKTDRTGAGTGAGAGTGTGTGGTGTGPGLIY